MHTKARIHGEIPAVIAAILLGIAVAGSARAQEGKPTQPRVGVAKAKETPPPPRKSPRLKVATQKLMRNPWEKPNPTVDVMTGHYGVSDEALPRFYW
jgi:hypothetical protein